ncbi:hypothetical protein [Mucilaginibacter sp.]|uniref:hypothetical protein n=1 Tax=Mucilaginibacter sp. TaxID=1882438 RepID=UPI002851E5C9|nr:hypothetical protein [Mucilaginibacter sp.]MDR3697348.1 hypothetical protein [Mucilaginibacter sp.]
METIKEIATKGGNSPRNNGKGDNKRFTAPQIPKLNFNGRKEPVHDTTWIVVRADFSDQGDRPLAPGSVFWESPDVWVQSSAGINQPVPGENNTVFATINNYGLQDATGIMVKFWWADPSLAITEATAHLIGTGFVDVPSGWSVTLQCPTPWVPVVENGGHECLIAEAFIQVIDPLTAPMDPMDDRHVGQKNEQLLLLQKGAKFVTRVKAVNITDTRKELRFDVQALHFDPEHPLVKLRAAKLPANVKPAGTTMPVALQFDESKPNFITKSILFAERMILRGLEKIEEELVEALEHSQVTHKAHFEPWESRTLEMTGEVPEDAEVGQSYLFRIVQRIGNMVTGGYTVHVVVV